MTRRQRTARGQSLVEFALVIPVFILLIFGLIDGGRLVYTYNTVANAARDAARVAIVNQSTSGAETCDTTSATAWPNGCGAASALALNVQPSDVTVVYKNADDSGDCATLTIGCLAEVTVTTSFTPFTPIAGNLIGTITISSQSKMPVERVCSNPTAAPIPHC